MAGCGRLGHGLAGGRTRLLRRERLGFFHVGRVIAGRAIHDGVFTGGGHHLEFLGQIAANGAAVCSHGAVLQAKTVKDAAVGLRHVLVTLLGRIAVAVKTVGVLHDELAPTHQAKTGTTLVTELGLNLVEIFRQLLVTAQFLLGNISDHFLGGGLNHEVSAMAVFDAQQLGAHLVEAPGFLPQLGGLHHRHGHLNSLRAVHFFAHDGLNLADHTQAHGHVGVDASAEFFDHAGAHHQLVTGDFGVGRGFFEGGNQELGGFHALVRIARGSEKSWVEPLDASRLLCIMASVEILRFDYA